MRDLAETALAKRSRLGPQDDIDYAQNYARGDPNPAQIHPAPPNIENKGPSVSCELTEGPLFAGQACKRRALPAELSARMRRYPAGPIAAQMRSKRAGTSGSSLT
jgi:hypothetical protein